MYVLKVIVQTLCNMRLRDFVEASWRIVRDQSPLCVLMLPSLRWFLAITPRSGTDGSMPHGMPASVHKKTQIRASALHNCVLLRRRT